VTDSGAWGRGSRGGDSLALAILDVANHRTDGLKLAYTQKALAESTATTGGYLPVPEIADTVLMLIRNRLTVLKMRVTHVKPQSK
jgi:hypothetical protein